ncbi:unnamed protein product [Phytophthora fragariaefolia]|uniref:Unnamed protein product n=1 Tax=Phytophthora fragariaefolia TaxID=1490495 RepID=A0A9W6XK80_9STRA|nr:unnamed protein product [Phytophthora fragariaefolia]
MGTSSTQRLKYAGRRLTCGGAAAGCRMDGWTGGGLRAAERRRVSLTFDLAASSAEFERWGYFGDCADSSAELEWYSLSARTIRVGWAVEPGWMDGRTEHDTDGGCERGDTATAGVTSQGIGAGLQCQSESAEGCDVWADDRGVEVRVAKWASAVVSRRQAYGVRRASSCRKCSGRIESDGNKVGAAVQGALNGAASNSCPLTTVRALDHLAVSTNSRRAGIFQKRYMVVIQGCFYSSHTENGTLEQKNGSRDFEIGGYDENSNEASTRWSSDAVEIGTKEGEYHDHNGGDTGQRAHDDDNAERYGRAARGSNESENGGWRHGRRTEYGQWSVSLRDTATDEYDGAFGTAARRYGERTRLEGTEVGRGGERSGINRRGINAGTSANAHHDPSRADIGISDDGSGLAGGEYESSARGTGEPNGSNGASD